MSGSRARTTAWPRLAAPKEPVAAAAARAVAAGLLRLIRGRGGQAAVEFVALMPLLLVAGLAGAAILAAHAADEQAAQAAQAGAMALIRGGDPRAAARRALPAGARGRARIVVRGRSVTVHVRPRVPVPGLSRRLTAETTAHAGPEPSP